MTAKDILQKTRAYLATGKWCKHMFSDSAGNCCLVAALDNFSGNNDSLFQSAKDKLDAALVSRAVISGRNYSVMSFNDHPDTKLQDVLALIDEALDE